MGTMPFYKTEPGENYLSDHDTKLTVYAVECGVSEAHLLADAGIASQDIGVLHDGQF